MALALAPSLHHNHHPRPLPQPTPLPSPHLHLRRHQKERKHHPTPHIPSHSTPCSLMPGAPHSPTIQIFRGIVPLAPYIKAQVGTRTLHSPRNCNPSGACGISDHSVAARWRRRWESSLHRRCGGFRATGACTLLLFTDTHAFSKFPRLTDGNGGRKSAIHDYHGTTLCTRVHILG